jgi:hypothetical protein
MNIEITIRDIKHLDTIISRLTKLNPTQINLTDKNGLTDNILLIETLRGSLPDAHFVPHYSFKNHTSKNRDAILENYTEFLVEANNQKLSEILLVSGHPRPKLDTLEGLKLAQNIQQEQELEPTQFAVAYNPFLTGHHLEQEKQRLAQKLEFDSVKRVYFQMGTLTHTLRDGVEYVRSLNKSVEITPSIVIPTSNFLSKFRFRPWKGVMLDEKYLANIKNATEKTKDLMRISQELQLSPLLEMVGFQHMDMDQFQDTYSGII